jgi:cytochrome P450
LTLIDREHVAKDKSLDFAELAGFFTLDILSKIAFGHPVGFLTQNKDVYDYHKQTAAFYPIMELSSNHPSVLSFFNSPMMRGAAPKPTDKVGFGAIVGEAHAAVAERFGSDAKHEEDMLGSFIRHGLTQQECEVEALLQILAGADSTATALRTTFLYILSSPSAYRKVQEEMASAIEAGNVTFPIIRNAEAQALPYLQACIQEGLRMFMPLQGLAGRVAPKGGDTVSGTFFPEGTEVGIATYAVGHRKDIYGPDADTYRPERWLDNSTETLKSYERVNELVFGAGRSSCLGKPIAMMELSKAIFEVRAVPDGNT